MTVSQRILEIMEQKHIKQKTLADYTGISTSAISDWKKKGTNPSVEKIVAISECLGVSVDYLLGRTEEPQKINYGVENHGDNNGAINNQVNSTNTSDGISISDGISKEMLVKFEELNFTDKVKVMSLIAELSQKE